MPSNTLPRNEIVKAILRAVDADKLRLAATSAETKSDLSSVTGVAEHEIDSYLDSHVKFEVGGNVIRESRRTVLQAMHNCC